MNSITCLRRASCLGLCGPAPIDCLDGLAVAAYDWYFAVCAATAADAGQVGAIFVTALLARELGGADGQCFYRPSLCWSRLSFLGFSHLFTMNAL